MRVLLRPAWLCRGGKWSDGLFCPFHHSILVLSGERWNILQGAFFLWSHWSQNRVQWTWYYLSPCSGYKSDGVASLVCSLCETRGHNPQVILRPNFASIKWGKLHLCLSLERVEGCAMPLDHSSGCMWGHNIGWLQQTYYPVQNQHEICIGEQKHARVDNENLRDIVRKCEILAQFKNLGNKSFNS